MSDFIWSLMNFFIPKIYEIYYDIFTSSYNLFEYISNIAFIIISEIYHLSIRLNNPGWSSDFLRLFSMGNKIEITTRLNTWQYWWWFWFCFGWAYYDGFFKRILCTRNFKIFISIYTSLRPHGKFGDFIACIIPAAWVINIVFNSNSLLKLTEWQNDTTVFNIRVRARQWYWLYYYDFKHIFEVFVLPKHIGWNNWRCDGFGTSKYYSSYINALESRSRDFSNAFEYWDEKVSEIIKNNYFKKQRPKIINNNINLIINIKEKHKLDNFIIINNNKKIQKLKYLSSNTQLQESIKIKIAELINKHSFICYNNEESKVKLNLTTKINNKINWFKINLIFKEINKKLDEIKLNHLNLNDLIFNENNLSFKKNPRKLIYDSLSSDSLDGFYFDGQKSLKILLDIKLDLNNSELKFLFKLNPNQNLNLEWWDNRGLALLLQKRLESPDLVPVDFLKSTQKIDYRLSNLKGARCFIESDSNNYIRKETQLVKTNLDVITQNKFTRNNTNPSYHLPSQFSKRLLRVTKTFVLPTLISLNVMTNSYDVVHSWFIPSLGIKFDCVPGKSTQHLLYIEYAGFFYGQCAEICGRYHHHMPIRIYACNLNYFLAWWSHIGFFKAISLNPYTEYKEFSTENVYIHNEQYWTGSRSNYIW